MHKIDYNKDTESFQKEIENFLESCQERLGYDEEVKIDFVKDKDNKEKLFCDTGFYSPENNFIGIYTSGRHIKDILRSLAHELTHHSQNCQGKLKDSIGVGADENYAQNSDKMREIEKEAYWKGNLLLRDYEDTLDSEKQISLNEKISKRYKNKMGFNFKL